MKGIQKSFILKTFSEFEIIPEINFLFPNKKKIEMSVLKHNLLLERSVSESVMRKVMVWDLNPNSSAY